MTVQLLDLVAEVVASRQSRRVRRVLVDVLLVSDDDESYRARVSCDGGKTWGWHRISHRELIAAGLPKRGAFLPLRPKRWHLLVGRWRGQSK